MKKINVASQIIAEASSAVGQMKAMMLYPMLPVLLISIVFVWFLYVGKFRQLFSPLVAMIFARVLFVFVCLFVCYGFGCWLSVV